VYQGQNQSPTRYSNYHIQSQHSGKSFIEQQSTLGLINHASKSDIHTGITTMADQTILTPYQVKFFGEGCITSNRQQQKACQHQTDSIEVSHKQAQKASTATQTSKN
jgi:hypothetical protein